MSYTAKIRMLFILVAVIPPLLILLFFASSNNSNAEKMTMEQHAKAISYANDYLILHTNLIQQNVKQLSENSEFIQFINSVRPAGTDDSRLIQSYQLDFAEIIDHNQKVILSFNRPGLLGLKLEFPSTIQTGIYHTEEYDREGQHAAITSIHLINDDYFLYAGQFIDSVILKTLDNITAGSTTFNFTDSARTYVDNMELFQLYNHDNQYKVLLTSPSNSQFYLMTFYEKTAVSLFNDSFILTILVIVVISILIAILLGIYITGKTKKEIDNLVTATAKVADGDFTTTVMAYEEGEFSTLAESFSNMVHKLKTTQHKLTTVERIAAWQTIGRKIAHEIKNPLSPISIAVDDLRSSYTEKLPNFDQTLYDTTGTIKTEVKRMTEMLDEFVSFARMKQSDLRPAELSRITEDILVLYANELLAGRFKMTVPTESIKLNLDPDSFKQVLINLIKNGFESAPDVSVSLEVKTEPEKVRFIIEDSGPGFTEEKLANSFEPFATTKKEGSGLGLVICHRIVHDHNGTMELYNNSSGGGGVTITLPV